MLHCCRRESITTEDLFYAHISGMDAMARGLRNAAALKVCLYMCACVGRVPGGLGGKGIACVHVYEREREHTGCTR